MQHKAINIWLESALDELWAPAVDWVFYNDGSAKKQLFEVYKSLDPKSRSALEQEVARVMGGPTLAYRNMKPGNTPSQMGGMSLSLSPPSHGNTMTFRVDPQDVLLHPAVAGGDNPLGSKAFGHEKEIILKLDAHPVFVTSTERMAHRVLWRYQSARTRHR